MRRSAVVTLTLAILSSSALAASPAGRVSPVSTPATDTSRVALDDATIVAIFDAANTADIETGKLAAERGASREVREFGAMLARDHQQVRQMGRDLAKKLGVTPTPPRDDQGAKDHAAAMKSLGSLRGPAFDRAFLRHEAAFHQAVISAVGSTLLPAIRNAELKALVEKVAPAFQAHMHAARQLEKNLAAKGGSASRGS